MTTTVVCIDDGIVRHGADGPRLIGARCSSCGTFAFPVQDGCARCSSTDMTVVELAPRGTLWTWTVQAFPPKAPPYLGETDPSRFEPFGVGYVELAGQLKVEARLTESDPARLRIGMEMELVLVPLAKGPSGPAERAAPGPDGTTMHTFAFRPVPEPATAGEGRP